MSLIDKETLQCQFCGFQRNKIDVLTVHIGSVHDKVEDFLPAEFHLPRSRSRPVKYSKISSTSHPESPVEQTRYEQTVETCADTGASVNFSGEEEPDSQQKGSKETENSVQTFIDEEDDLSNIRNIFDDSDDDYE